MSWHRDRNDRARALADLVTPALGPALAANGFASNEIVLRWPEIVGPELARHCEPIKLSWPPKAHAGRDDKPPATLLIRVESAFSLELQMQAALVVERVNQYLGWGCVGSIRLRQGPVVPKAPPGRRALTVSAEAETRIAAATEGVEDERLAEALRRLGRGVVARRSVG